MQITFTIIMRLFKTNNMETVYKNMRILKKINTLENIKVYHRILIVNSENFGSGTIRTSARGFGAIYLPIF